MGQATERNTNSEPYYNANDKRLQQNPRPKPDVLQRQREIHMCTKSRRSVVTFIKMGKMGKMGGDSCCRAGVVDSFHEQMAHNGHRIDQVWEQSQRNTYNSYPPSDQIKQDGNICGCWGLFACSNWGESTWKVKRSHTCHQGRQSAHLQLQWNERCGSSAHIAGRTLALDNLHTFIFSIGSSY